MRHLMGKSGDIQWSQPMEEDMYAVGKSVRGTWLPKCFGTKVILVKLYNGRYGNAGFGVCSAGCWSYLVQFF